MRIGKLILTAVLLVGAFALGRELAAFWSYQWVDTPPLAPGAAEAPAWTPPTPPPISANAREAPPWSPGEPLPVSPDAPAYGLPIEITTPPLPEVPERIRGPSPPLKGFR